MAKSQEERFPHWKTVGSLKQFLLEKKRRIDSGISDGTISKVSTAEEYLAKISVILDSNYFKFPNTRLTIKEFMVMLKKEDIILKEEIEKFQKKIELEEEEITNFSESKAHRDFSIPDEDEIFLAANTQATMEKLTRLREELSDYQYRLRVCRWIKGIICRPNGFFEAVWKT